MAEPPIYQQTSSQLGGNPMTETPAPVNEAPVDLDAQVEALVAAQLSAVESKYADRIAALEAQLSSQVPPATAVPQHAGGNGLEVAPTWSQAEQEAARAEAG
jgi:hypothetical protein